VTDVGGADSRSDIAAERERGRVNTERRVDTAKKRSTCSLPGVNKHVSYRYIAIACLMCFVKTHPLIR
jgi:hypothetical protein